jgi:hypothetical protein
MIGMEEEKMRDKRIKFETRHLISYREFGGGHRPPLQGIIIDFGTLFVINR